MAAVRESGLHRTPTPPRGTPRLTDARAGGSRNRWSRWFTSPGPVHAWDSGTRALIRTITELCDFVVPLAALAIVIVVANRDAMPNGVDDFLEMRFTVKNFLLVAGFALIWRVLCLAGRLYDFSRIQTAGQEALRVITVAAAGGICALAFPYLSVSGAIGYGDVQPFWVITSIAMLLQRHVIRGLVLRARQEVLIVGTGPRAAALYESLLQGSRGVVTVLGFVDDEHPHSCELLRPRVLGGLDDLERILMTRAVDQVLVTLPVRSHYQQVQNAIDICASVGVRAEYLADLFEGARRQPLFEEAPQFATMALPVTSEDRWKLFVKRTIDVTGAALGLVMMAPILLGIAIAVKVSSPGPVLYRQVRYGYRKRRFTMYKFRTMVADAEARQAELEPLNEATGAVFKLRNDPRVTSVGHFLRRSSLDELPQLFNVLFGDMSLVGPRPLPLRDVGRFTEATLMRRFSVRPGITGLWQVSGRSDLPFDTWIRLDLQYVDEWSLALDCGILIRTIPAVLRGTGAS